jgi:phosphotransferase family enzyme
MSSERSEGELLSSLHSLVSDNAEGLFAAWADDVRVEHLKLSKELHRRETRHHRVLAIRYSVGAETREQRVWLKFLAPDPDAEVSHRELYERHVAAWRQTAALHPLFPRPYFYAEWHGTGMIAMEMVQGTSLRRLYLPRMFIRASNVLTPRFAALGRALRAFHDAFDPAGFTPVDELAARGRSLVEGNPHLAADERAVLAEQVVSAAATVRGAPARLPSIPIHHDCTLRNVLVRPDGSPCLLDLDAVTASEKSRWYDVVIFLINLESQLKYAPLAHDAAIAAAWRGFMSGYLASAPPDGLSTTQLTALLYLVKVDYVFAGTWLPVFDVYTGRLASRYLNLLKRSLLEGRCTAFKGDALAG